jgi:hypothetical protein
VCFRLYFLLRAYTILAMMPAETRPIVNIHRRAQKRVIVPVGPQMIDIRKKRRDEECDCKADQYHCTDALPLSSGHRPNEKKMSDGGRERALLGVEVWKSSQKWSVRRSAIRSIAWLGFMG